MRRLPADCTPSDLSAALHSGEPFVISLQQKDVPDQDVSALKQRLAGRTVHGWQGEKSIELSINEVVDLWLEDRLPCNIVDSYVKVRHFTCKASKFPYYSRQLITQVVTQSPLSIKSGTWSLASDQ